MSLFIYLPDDVQRLVCFLYLEYKDIKKISPKFYNDENDVYWKEKVSTMTDEKTPEDTTHRTFYESFIYEKVLEKQSFSFALVDEMIRDEIFLTRHIDAKDRQGWTALMFTSKYDKDKEMTKLLVKAGANVNIQNYFGRTALMVAVNNCNEIATELLLSANADVNLQSSYGNTALILAVENGNENIIKRLLIAGANVNLQTKSGWTALMCTLHYSRKKHIINALLIYGADINITDNMGRKAIDYCSSDDIKNLLLSR
jgi:ankyrin repeat protein